MHSNPNFFHSLNQLSRHFTKALNEALIPLGLYAAQWSVVSRLKVVHSSSQRELSNYLGIEAPTMTRTLSRMESAGWIKKVPGEDRREKFIQLTDAALKEYPNWLDAVERLEKRFLEVIKDDELKIMTSFMEKLKKHLNEGRDI